MDVTQRPADKWIVDFAEHAENEATLFEAPFSHVLAHVKPERDAKRRKKYARKLVAIQALGRRYEARHRLSTSFNCYPGSCQAPRFRLACPEDRSRQKPYRQSPAPTTPPSASCIPASTNSGRCASAPRSKTVRATPTSTTFETFPFPAGLTPRDTAPVAGQASPPCLAGADRRRQHRRRRPPPQRTARSLAQPGRVGRLGHHPGRGKSRLPQTPGRQTRPRSRPQEAHPDQPLQRPPRLARPRPQAARPGRRHRLRLARLLSGNARRRNPPPPAGAESGTEPGVLRLKLFNF